MREMWFAWVPNSPNGPQLAHLNDSYDKAVLATANAVLEKTAPSGKTMVWSHSAGPGFQ